MSLQLITGAANAGKTGVAYDRVRDLMAVGGRPVLLVPSGPDVERASDELSREFPVGLRVSTFERYVHQAWDRFGDGRAIVSAERRGLLCTAAARTAGGSRGLAGLTAECAQSLAEQTGPLWRQAHASSTGPGAMLACALRGYATSLHEDGLIEPAEATHLLAQHGEHADALVLHRFTDFTPSQRALIRAYAQRAEVSVTVTSDPECAATHAAAMLIERLGPCELTAVPSATFDTDATLQRLAQSLFGAPERLKAGPSVRFSLAEGNEAEAQRIVEEIQAALLEGTASSEERIAVVFRDPERHVGVLKQAFAEAGIRADFDALVPFGSTAFGSAVLHALGFATTGARSDLMALLRSPFSGVAREEVRALERRWRSKGTVERGELLSGTSRVAPRLAAAVRQMEAAATRLDAEGLGLLANAINSLFVLGYGRSGFEDRACDESSAWAHRAVIDMLSETSLLSAGRTTLADLRDALGELKLAPARTERVGHVQVTSVTRVRGRRFDTVVIGGLNAGEFPKSAAESMLPGSAVDDVLRAFGGSAEPALGPEYEQYLFYLVVTRAKKRLVLSARSTDDDGDPVRLSPFFEVAADSFRDRDDDDQMPPHVYRVLAQAPGAGVSAGERERVRAGALAGARTTPQLRSAARRAAPRTPGLSDAALLEGLSERMVFSASEIEAYLQCPYRWFLQYGVRPRELEREFGPADQGTYAHALLAGTYSILREAGVQRVAPDALVDAHRALEEAIARAEVAFGQARDLSEQIARTSARAWAARVLADDARMFEGFNPVYLEWGFGGEGERVEVGSFYLTGRVDRIDVDEQGRAIIIDYKRSGVPTAAHILDKGRVQIPLYFSAVSSVLGLTPVAGLYRSLAKRENRGVILAGALPSDSFTRTDVKEPEEFGALVEAGLGLAEQAVEDIRAGRIPCEPRTNAACGYCQAAVFCGARR